jgi:hypothetical protein
MTEGRRREKVGCRFHLVSMGEEFPQSLNTRLLDPPG